MLKILMMLTLLNVPVKNVDKSHSHFTDHAKFSSFWNDFKSAVIKNDHNAVLKMTSIPFTDQYQEIYFKAYGGKKPLTCKTTTDFLQNYDAIFIPNVIAAIKADKYRLWKKDKNENQGLGQQYYRSGLYILEVNDFNKRGYNLALGKKEGIYKLCYIPYYE